MNIPLLNNPLRSMLYTEPDKAVTLLNTEPVELVKETFVYLNNHIWLLGTEQYIVFQKKLMVSGYYLKNPEHEYLYGGLITVLREKVNKLDLYLTWLHSIPHSTERYNYLKTNATKLFIPKESEKNINVNTRLKNNNTYMILMDILPHLTNYNIQKLLLSVFKTKINDKSFKDSIQRVMNDAIEIFAAKSDYVWFSTTIKLLITNTVLTKQSIPPEYIGLLYRDPKQHPLCEELVKLKYNLDFNWLLSMYTENDLKETSTWTTIQLGADLKFASTDNLLPEFT